MSSLASRGRSLEHLLHPTQCVALRPIHISTGCVVYVVGCPPQSLKEVGSYPIARLFFWPISGDISLLTQLSMAQIYFLTRRRFVGCVTVLLFLLTPASPASKRNRVRKQVFVRIEFQRETSTSGPSERNQSKR